MRTILVVEDEEDFRRILDRVLGLAGYRVRLGASAELGLELARAETPDLALVDWNLPGMSGVEFCRRMRADEKLSGVPLAMLTVRSAPEEQLQGLGDGLADAYLIKPVEPEELLARVERLLATASGREGGAS